MSPHRRVGLIELACCALFALGLAIGAPDVRAVESADAAASQSMQQFLARESPTPSYRALRRLEAENRGRTAWLEAWTTFTPGEAFEYLIVSEGGSPSIRSRVLRAVLEGEKEAIDRGETTRSALAASNYRFESDGLDPAGLVRVALVPRRNEGVLVAGAMFLKPADGELVRLEGRLARNPSFWVKQVDIIRSYARIEGAVLPIALESRAQLRLLGPATFRMTYEYAEIDGAPVGSRQ
ncbi:MAG TPA: hypothetical protein VIX63_17430 [Vicinamibacterales bacterium]